MKINSTIEEVYNFYKKYPEHMGKIKVNSRFGYKKILACEKTAINSEVYEIETISGIKLKTSPDHLLLSNNNEWIKVKKLRSYKHFLFSKFDIEQIKSIKKLNHKSDLYDLQVDKVKEFYANNIVSHNSALLSSIYFAITGKAYQNIPKGKLVNNKNKKNLLVELEIEHQGKKYLIRRGIWPNVFEIIKEGVLIDEDSNIRDYQKQLETIIGIDYKTFKQTIMMSARHYIPFLELKKSDKREFIENIFSLKLFSDINDFLKRKIQNTKQNIKGLNKDISHYIQSLQMLKDISSKQINLNKFQKQNLLDGIKKLGGDIEQLQEDINNKIKEIQEYDEDNSIKKEKIKFKKKIIKRVDILKYNVKQHNEKKEFFEQNTECENCGKHLEPEFRDEQISQLETDINEKQNNLEELQLALEKINNIEEKFNFNIKKINSLRQEIMLKKSQQDGIEFNINEKKELINNINESSSINKDKFIDINNDLIKSRKNKKQLEIFLKYSKLTIEMISEKGIKKFIISRYIPVLNTLLNKYLKIFEAPYSVMFNNELEENIIARGYEDLGYGNLSAGEKQRLDTSLVFSFLELCKMKNSVNVNLIILDEILDQSLDTTGINGILKILENMKEQGYTILTVSHREFFADEFDKVYKVLKKKFSVIEEVE